MEKINYLYILKILNIINFYLKNNNSSKIFEGNRRRTDTPFIVWTENNGSAVLVSMIDAGNPMVRSKEALIWVLEFLKDSKFHLQVQVFPLVLYNFFNTPTRKGLFASYAFVYYT